MKKIETLLEFQERSNAPSFASVVLVGFDGGLIGLLNIVTLRVLSGCTK
jgi:hypothetical protein